MKLFGKKKKSTRRRVRIAPVIEEEVGNTVGSRFLSIMAHPVHRTMDYLDNCPHSREECQRMELLSAMREEYEESMPGLAKAGKPGPDLVQFRGLPPFCQACLLARRPKGMLRRR